MFLDIALSHTQQTTVWQKPNFHIHRETKTCVRPPFFATCALFGVWGGPHSSPRLFLPAPPAPPPVACPFSHLRLALFEDTTAASRGRSPSVQAHTGPFDLSVGGEPNFNNSRTGGVPPQGRSSVCLLHPGASPQLFCNSAFSYFLLRKLSTGAF